MRAKHRSVAAATLVAALAAAVTLLAPSAGATNHRAACPSEGTPAPGSTVSGGLEVDGYCELHGVTVTGGVYVDPTPVPSFVVLNWLNLIGSTVSGGVVVGDGSEADSNIDYANIDLLPEHSRINGGLTLDHAAFSVMGNAMIEGGVTINGSKDMSSACGPGATPADCWGAYIFCGLTIDGNVAETDVNFAQAFNGDPEEQFFNNSDCPGNTIHGSVTLKDSNFIRFDGEPSEIEGNTVTGSVHVDHSTAEVNENTIGGSLLCTNGSVIHPPPAPDIAGNTVRGKDTCD